MSEEMKATDLEGHAIKNAYRDMGGVVMEMESGDTFTLYDRSGVGIPIKKAPDKGSEDSE